MVGLRAPGVEGGIEHAVAELAPRLVARGCDVTVFCRDRYNPHGNEFSGVKLVDLPTVYTKHLEALVHTGLAVTRSGAFDVVHVHASGPGFWSFVPRALGAATVVTLHGLDWRRAKWGSTARLALRTGARSARTFAHTIIAVSREVEDVVGRTSNRVVRIPNGVSDIPFATLDEADVAGLEPGYLLVLGRLVPEKSVETAVVAHTQSGTSRPLVITGGQGHTPEYATLLETLAGPDVHFTGPRFGAAKAALLHNAGAVLFPSRLEGLPLGVLEAMECARPILASDIPPHRELLGTGCGQLLPPGDIEAWAAAIASLDAQANPGARQRVRRDFGWDPVADRTLAVYEQALGDRGVVARALSRLR